MARLLLVFVVLLASLPAAAQWSYVGETMCFANDSVTQCSSIATVFDYAVNRTSFVSSFNTYYSPYLATSNTRYRPNASRTQRSDYDAQYAAGYAIGSAIGGLLNRWDAHSQANAHERDDLEIQYRNYLNAFDSLVNDLIAQCESAQVSYKNIATYAPNLTFAQADLLTQNAASARQSCDRQEQLKKQHRNAGEIIAKAKDRKFLKQQVAAIEEQYGALYDVAAEGYVYTELMRGLAGYYESKMQGDAHR